MATQKRRKQNLTVSLDQTVIHKAKVIAAQRSTSISDLVAQQIESLVSADEGYERAKKHALAMLDRGFHLGGEFKVSRDELHER